MSISFSSKPDSVDPVPSVQAAEIDKITVASFVPEPLLDTDEAAAIMKIHPKTLQKYARDGRIPGVHIGKLWRFRASVIEQWIQQQLAS